MLENKLLIKPERKIINITEKVSEISVYILRLKDDISFTMSKVYRNNEMKLDWLVLRLVEYLKSIVYEKIFCLLIKRNSKPTVKLKAENRVFRREIVQVKRFLGFKNRILGVKLSKWNDISCFNWINLRLKKIVEFSRRKSKESELLIMNNSRKE